MTKKSGYCFGHARNNAYFCNLKSDLNLDSTMKRFWQKTFKWLLIACVACASVIAVCNIIVLQASRGRLYDRVADVPHRHAALVGTNRVSRWGGRNPYYYNRIDTNGKPRELHTEMDSIIVSGDNLSKYYNEPDMMRADLVARGVPDSVIHSDFAGLRTLDSVVRANKIFGQDSVLVVSQQFHNERAIYLAKAHGIDAIGMNAGNWRKGRLRFHMMARECLLARPKAVIDILFGKRPRYGGDTIDIG